MSSVDVLGCLWSVVFQNKISRYIVYVVQSSSWSVLNFINDNKTLYLNNLLTKIKWNILAHRHQAPHNNTVLCFSRKFKNIRQPWVSIHSLDYFILNYEYTRWYPGLYTLHINMKGCFVYWKRSFCSFSYIHVLCPSFS